VSEPKRSPRTGPDEADYAVWETADLIELLRRKASPAVARQAARAGLEAVKAFEGHLPVATLEVMRRQQRASK
jgi:hypothetical protein